MTDKRLVSCLLLVLLITFPVQAQEERNRFELEAGSVYGFFNLTAINDHLQARNDYLNNDLIKGPASPVAGSISAEDITSLQPLKTGIGCWSRGLMWTSSRFALGSEVEYLTLSSVYGVEDSTTTYYWEEYNLELTGLSGVIVYSLPLSKKAFIQQKQIFDKLRLDFMLGLGGYRGSFDYQRRMNFSGILEAGTEEEKEAVYNDYQWGGKTGVELIISLINNLTINCGVNYRYLVFEQLTNDQDQGYNSRYSGDMEPEEFDFSGLEVTSSFKFKF